MNRLTKRTTNCPLPVLVRDRALGPGYFVSEQDYTDYRDALEKLAQYEDTGLEPEEMKELLHDTTGPLHRKLGTWIKAEAEGRLVVLPCKVGTKVYDIISGKIKEKYYYNLHGYNDGDFGRVVFLNREDAEKALEGMSDDG